MKPGDPVKPKSDKKKEVGHTYNFFKRQQEAAEAARRAELIRRRIDIARTGLKHFRDKKPVEAVKSYQSYLKIMEDYKGVGEGGLTPAHFDRKKEMAELFLISGIFWDLMKLYDRTQSTEKKREFLQFVEKFILFSKNTPFQVLSAESLRKYILLEKPVHMAEFEHAYKMLVPPSKCFIASSLVDVSDLETLPRLRRFRDEVLEASIVGSVAVKVYYLIAPMMTLILDRCPQSFRRRIAKNLDRFARNWNLKSISAKSSRFARDGK